MADLAALTSSRSALASRWLAHPLPRRAAITKMPSSGRLTGRDRSIAQKTKSNAERFDESDSQVSMAKSPKNDDFYHVAGLDHGVARNHGQAVGQDHRAQDSGALISGQPRHIFPIHLRQSHA